MRTESRLARYYLEEHPLDAARLLEGLPPDQVLAAIDGLPAESTANVMARMGADAAANLVRGLPVADSAGIFEQLEVRAATRILLRLAPADRESLLLRLSASRSRRLKRLLDYGPATAGALMDPAVAAFPAELDAASALHRVRRLAGSLRYYVYATDPNGRLVGVLTLRELVAAPGSRAISAIAKQPVKQLRVRDSRQSILDHPGWRLHHSLPVTEADGTLVGVLNYETMRGLEADATAERPPDLLAVGTTLGEAWIRVAATLLDGLGGSLVASRRPGGKTTVENEHGTE